jgi:hypothetical protein
MVLIKQRNIEQTPFTRTDRPKGRGMRLVAMMVLMAITLLGVVGGVVH